MIILSAVGRRVLFRANITAGTNGEARPFTSDCVDLRHPDLRDDLWKIWAVRITPCYNRVGQRYVDGSHFSTPLGSPSCCIKIRPSFTRRSKRYASLGRLPFLFKKPYNISNAVTNECNCSCRVDMHRAYFECSVAVFSVACVQRRMTALLLWGAFSISFLQIEYFTLLNKNERMPFSRRRLLRTCGCVQRRLCAASHDSIVVMRRAHFECSVAC